MSVCRVHITYVDIFVFNRIRVLFVFYFFFSTVPVKRAVTVYTDVILKFSLIIFTLPTRRCRRRRRRYVRLETSRTKFLAYNNNCLQAVIVVYEKPRAPTRPCPDVFPNFLSCTTQNSLYSKRTNNYVPGQCRCRMTYDRLIINSYSVGGEHTVSPFNNIIIITKVTKY